MLILKNYAKALTPSNDEFGEDTLKILGKNTELQSNCYCGIYDFETNNFAAFTGSPAEISVISFST